ncbi:hypothetical protein VV93_v1c19420 [Vibrio vulnificus]|nr:hypothetical protein VV93_v1c19420 [Vibrio vulnificus]OJI37519.1 hypothetical protein VVDAL79087_03306 [Vibrio vulnificus]
MRMIYATIEVYLEMGDTRAIIEDLDHGEQKILINLKR